MSLKSTINRPFTRRRFLMASSSLAAAGAIGSILPAGVTSALADEGSKELLSGSHWGAFYGKVEDGRFVSLRPWEKDPHPNPALDGVQDVVYNAARIRYPMVRRAYLENGPNAERDSRGAGDFVRVSWDQALDLVAKEIARQQDVGPWSIYASSYGWKSSGHVSIGASMVKRLMNLTGGAVFSTDDYSKGAMEGIMQYIMGQIDGEGPQTTHDTILENTDLTVFWCSDPLKDNAISGGIPDHGEWKWFEQMKAAGKKTLFIDPVKTVSCKEVDGEWLPIRPHSDVALALALCHVLLTEDLYDKDFVENYTFGFDKFAEYLKGNGWDKVEKTPEWAEELTEVSADYIRNLARQMVAGRTMLVSGWTNQRQHHGEQWVWSFITLGCMIGQIGLPGGGFCQRYHLDNPGVYQSVGPRVGYPISTGKRNEIKEWPAEKGNPTIPIARIVDMLEKPLQPYTHQGNTLLYPDVKMTYWCGGNPFHHHQDTNRMRQAWKKFETVVIQDFQWTASARFADIVLPATTTAEHDDIDCIGNVANLAIVKMSKLIDPVFEARDDWDIFVDLAKRLGVEKEFTNGKSTLKEMIADVYNQARSTGEKTGVAMPDFDTFWEQGIVEFDVPEKGKGTRVKYADFREDPLMNMMPTPTGKIQLFSNAVEKFAAEDCPPHASWLEPAEWLGQKDMTYPMHLDSNHPPYRLHSQLCGTKVRDLYAVNGREPCWINPEEAAARGIADGDLVRVFNGRGQILVGAVVTEDIRPGVLQVCEGAWYDPEDVSDPKSLDRYGSPNTLTIDIGTSSVIQATSAHTCMVQIEKFEGVAPEVDVFTAPAGAA